MPVIPSGQTRPQPRGVTPQQPSGHTKQDILPDEQECGHDLERCASDRDLAIIYTRVSTSKQEHNYSLVTQLDASHAYAWEHGFDMLG